MDKATDAMAARLINRLIIIIFSVCYYNKFSILILGAELGNFPIPQTSSKKNSIVTAQIDLITQKQTFIRGIQSVTYIQTSDSRIKNAPHTTLFHNIKLKIQHIIFLIKYIM